MRALGVWRKGKGGTPTRRPSTRQHHGRQDHPGQTRGPALASCMILPSIVLSNPAWAPRPPPLRSSRLCVPPPFSSSLSPRLGGSAGGSSRRGAEAQRKEAERETDGNRGGLVPACAGLCLKSETAPDGTTLTDAAMLRLNGRPVTNQEGGSSSLRSTMCLTSSRSWQTSGSDAAYGRRMADPVSISGVSRGSCATAQSVGSGTTLKTGNPPSGRLASSTIGRGWR